jgi:hypothetical protein
MMKKYCVAIGMMMACVTGVLSAQDSFQDILGSVLSGGGGGDLSNETIIKGLLEALEIGTGNAVSTVSRLDGYFTNETIKILLPEHIQKAETLIRLAGRGDIVDDFILSMNRAAEGAAPEAGKLFTEAIKQMTFSDAHKILKGRDNEATLYFQETMGDRLFETFLPLVQGSLEKTDITRQYKTIETTLATLPISGVSGFNLETYVTQKALDGLFQVVAEEERKIRRDPAARVTDILKTVFGD